MSLEQTIKDTLIAESVDLDMRLQQLVRAGLMPSNTIPLLRKAITKIQGGYPLQGAERDVMANFLNSMMFIVLGDDAIFNKARVGAKGYAAEEVEQIDELSKKTLGSYVKKAKKELSSSDYHVGRAVGARETGQKSNFSPELERKLAKRGKKRYHGIDKAVDKMMTKEDVELEEKRGLWDNIHAKRKRIKAGSGERMRKPGSEGAPSAADLKNSRVDEGNKVVANTNDPESMKKYTADVVKRARDARKALTKESRRTEALADIAAVAQMNESYKTTFDAALTQYGIKSPSELDEEKRKQFFNFVDQEYKKGDK